MPSSPHQNRDSQIISARFVAANTPLGRAKQALLSDIARELSQALAQIDPDERLAVVLRDVEQLPMRDVSEVLGVGLSAAKMRVHRGRQSLRVLLKTSELQP